MTPDPPPALLNLKNNAELTAVPPDAVTSSSTPVRNVMTETSSEEMDALPSVKANVETEESTEVKNVTKVPPETTTERSMDADLDVSEPSVVMESEIPMRIVITELPTLTLSEMPAEPTVFPPSVETELLMLVSNVTPLLMSTVTATVKESPLSVETETSTVVNPVMPVVPTLTALPDVELTVLSPSVVTESSTEEL